VSEVGGASGNGHREQQRTDADPGRAGQGNEDRYTLLSEPAAHGSFATTGRRFRPDPWLFPGRSPASISPGPRARARLPRRLGVVPAIAKGSGIHTLRHCFATHLWEAGWM